MSEPWYSHLLIGPGDAGWTQWRDTYCIYPDDLTRRAKVWRGLVDEIGVLPRDFGLWDAFGLLSGARPWWHSGLTDDETREVVATVAAYLEHHGIGARVRRSRTHHPAIMLREDQTETHEQCARIVDVVQDFPGWLRHEPPRIPEAEREPERRWYR